MAGSLNGLQYLFSLNLTKHIFPIILSIRNVTISYLKVLANFSNYYLVAHYCLV